VRVIAWHSFIGKEIRLMSRTTDHLNDLLDLKDEELNAQIGKRIEAEQSLTMTKEARDYAREQMLALRTLRDRDVVNMERLQDRCEALVEENNRLHAQLDKYISLRVKEAAAWLRETSIEDLTTLINEERNRAFGDTSRHYRPLVDKIPVIKAVRNKWDIGLKDSKDVVDAWYAEQPVGGIEQYQAEGR
jgi:hypothetical protein